MGSGDVSKVNTLRKFKTFAELEKNMRENGVESLQSCIFVDFSKSNTWQGQKTYGHGLHDTTQPVTPYESCINILANVLHTVDDDDLYPIYRFGCVDTKDRTVCPILYPHVQNEHFQGIEAVKQAYRQALQFVQLSGPTTLAPAINKAIEISKAYQARGESQHIVCIILTDGDISDMEKDTAAVCNASNYPISICVVGLGDGPFTKLEKFDFLKKGRRFDNLKYTNFTAFSRQTDRMENPELEFATDVFVEIGAQHRAMVKLKLL